MIFCPSLKKLDWSKSNGPNSNDPLASVELAQVERVGFHTMTQGAQTRIFFAHSRGDNVAPNCTDVNEHPSNASPLTSHRQGHRSQRNGNLPPPQGGTVCTMSCAAKSRSVAKARVAVHVNREIHCRRQTCPAYQWGLHHALWRWPSDG